MLDNFTDECWVVIGECCYRDLDCRWHDKCSISAVNGASVKVVLVLLTTFARSSIADLAFEFSLEECLVTSPMKVG